MHTEIIQSIDSNSERFVGARICAIRFDLIPWSLVLDLDIPSVPPATTMSRGWVVLMDIGQISITLENALIPNGIYITDFSILRDGDPFLLCDFHFAHTKAGVAGSFGGHGSVKAKNCLLLQTEHATQKEEANMLSWESRESLISDAKFLEYFYDWRDRL